MDRVITNTLIIIFKTDVIFLDYQIFEEIFFLLDIGVCNKRYNGIHKMAI